MLWKLLDEDGIGDNDSESGVHCDNWHAVCVPSQQRLAIQLGWMESCLIVLFVY